MQDLFQSIQGQDHVVNYLRQVLASDTATHAYLICGAQGCGKTQIALNFAAGLLAQQDESELQSALRLTHPDLHIIQPEGASGYVIDQVRDVVRDAEMAPVRGLRKVYVFNQVERFNAASANAFLKTLEEPPTDVVIIMLASSQQAVLDTICSRCQVLVCNAVASAERSNHSLVELAYQAASGADDLTLLRGATIINHLGTDEIDELQKQHDEQQKSSNDFLSQGAKKELQKRQEREVKARQRQVLYDAFDGMEQWLRDCLMVNQGASQLIADTSMANWTQKIAQTSNSCGLLKAIDAVHKARTQISYNVTPQLALEACLFEIREAVCPQ